MKYLIYEWHLKFNPFDTSNNIALSKNNLELSGTIPDDLKLALVTPIFKANETMN
jgi:hypothetical protein